MSAICVADPPQRIIHAMSGKFRAMLATGDRPRELHWYHAGPMLFGDWGTSRLYVLGLAFAFTGHASFWFIAAMCVLMVGVGWSYEIICRLFPDGGGVYSSARHRSQLLAVVGGLLLCADYVVTASLSCLDAFHYLGLKDRTLLDLIQGVGLHGVTWSALAIPIDAVAAAITILAIGALNFAGPKKAGTVAMVVAIATVIATLIIGIVYLTKSGTHPPRIEVPRGGVWKSWVGFTEMILALSGVEAIANMTGIMVEPVEKTARKAILPVLIEIVILNLILGAAMNALPDSILNARSPVTGELEHTGDMLKVIASYFVDPIIPMFSAVSAVIFAALLLSAVNTALADLVSIQFMLSRDKELPAAFSGLNRFGMPVLPLIVGSIIPAVVVLIFSDVEKLSGLYAIGVVGAISINLGTTSTNKALALKPWERGFMFGLTIIMVVVGITICIVKPHARSFALLVLTVGLAGRLATIMSNKTARVPAETRRAYLALAIASVLLSFVVSYFGDSDYPLATIDLPGLGRRVLAGRDVSFLLSVGLAGLIGAASVKTQPYRQAILDAEAAAQAAALAAAPARPKMLLPGAYTPKYRIMVPTQGSQRLIDFAMQECKIHQAELQLLYIRLLAVTPMGPTAFPTLAEDPEALALFDRVRQQAKAAGVPLRLLYGVASDIPDAILDMAVTHGADLLLMGVTRRGTLWKVMKGDIIQAVAEQLPEQVGLLIHA
ncbi:MAG: amino acid transporter [Planctomycetota bacterium]|nr:amino acid transporter [Planctomycetota bacterium]